ncbi:HEPN domain-containing protein [Alloalcanivorax xenomutans]|uniref:HEPN domain-containing protein n=1 Tax=Alloalcanivorax xenomutans TaxID=1094342 RepID=UPI00292CE153|nr:HEPN domain-containing protein [Alloalcanivorax xenomutans]WOA30213.1 HEPN domain-containing protein [Alloalcanivorax xenomutans]
MESRHHNLKTRQRRERHGYPDNLSLRVHRALSWLDRAEQEADPDSRFIFLWIAFNAAYATEIDDREGLSEQHTFNAFLKKLHDLDKGARLNDLVWTAYPNAIRVLLDNPYVFSCFWDYQKGQKTEDQWKHSFDAAKKAANHALAQQDTPRLLAIVLSRIYTLRNQLIHGGATWNSSVNRDQIRDCVNLMGELVPAVIEIMMDSPNTLWGEASYPVVETK